MIPPPTTRRSNRPARRRSSAAARSLIAATIQRRHPTWVKPRHPGPDDGGAIDGRGSRTGTPLSAPDSVDTHSCSTCSNGFPVRDRPACSGGRLVSRAVTAPQQPFKSDVQSQPSSTLLPPPARLQSESLCLGLLPEPASVINAQLLNCLEMGHGASFDEFCGARVAQSVVAESGPGALKGRWSGAGDHSNPVLVSSGEQRRTRRRARGVPRPRPPRDS